MSNLPTKKTKSVQATKDSNPNNLSRVIGSVLIVLSGIILYTDKVFELLGIELDNLHGWKSTEVFVWTLCQTISPLIIMLGMYLRPFFVSLAVPVFCYALQYYFVMDSDLTNDNPLALLYSSVTTALILIIIWVIRRKLDQIHEVRSLKTDLLQEFYDNEKDQ